MNMVAITKRWSILLIVIDLLEQFFLMPLIGCLASFLLARNNCLAWS